MNPPWVGSFEATHAADKFASDIIHKTPYTFNMYTNFATYKLF